MRRWLEIWGGYAAVLALAGLVGLVLAAIGVGFLVDGLFDNGDTDSLMGGTLWLVAGVGIIAWALNR